MRRSAWAGGFLLGLVLLTTPSYAVITAKTPLSAVLKDMSFICAAKIDAFDADKLTMVLTIDEQLKGKAPFTRMPVNLKATNKLGEKEIPVLTKRLAVRLPVVIFFKDRMGGDYDAFIYTNGTWFMLLGTTPKDVDSPRWIFNNLEPYLRRTFKGTTAELREVVIDALSGKKAPPAWDEKEKPGIGPEVKKEEKTGRAGTVSDRSEVSTASTPLANAPGSPLTSGPVFGVIPSVIIGGPLAILAMLFPTWFGGWKRWFTLIVGLSTASTVIFVYWLWGHHFATSLWGTDFVQWLMITIVIILSAAWAWQRHLVRLRNNEAPEQPGLAEFIVLGALVLMSFGTLFVVYRWFGANLKSPSWLILVPMAVSAVIGMGFVVVVRLLRSHAPQQTAPWEELDLWTPAAPSSNGDADHASSGGGVATAVAETKVVTVSKSAAAPARPPALATEVVMLTAMAVICTALTAILPRGSAGNIGPAVTERYPVTGGEQKWLFRPDSTGTIASSPLVVGDRVYIAGSVGTLGSTGVIYCLDRGTGKLIWDSSSKIKRMKPQSISSPVVVDGKLYIGEGFHQDSGCKVYCLDAANGSEIWSFETTSHTESSPFVTGGKVYIGAGDDGLYCIDATTGKEVWHFEKYHIDASPVVHQNRLYVGSGKGDEYQATAIFCIDATTGKPIWKHDLDVPAWGSPVVAGDLVYFGIGNGDFEKSEEKPAGALLCVNASDGREVWRFATEDGVLNRPTVDRARVWAGSRDGNLYCLDRRTGELYWKRAVGSPMLVSPAIARGKGELANAVYALGSAGQVFCLEPNTGAVCWQRDLTDSKPIKLALWSSPRLVVTGHDKGTERRQLIFGATLGSDDSPSPAVFCIEDRLAGSPDDVIVESRP